jgi:hypothetical protein
MHMADLSPEHPMVSHLPAMPRSQSAAPAFRIREEKRVAVGWFGEGRLRAATHGAMNMAGVRRLPWCHLRQQPVAVDADAPRFPDRAHRGPRLGLRPRGSSTAPTCSPSTARRSARSRRRGRAGADADRVPDPADGGPRRPRRRLLRPEGHVRGGAKSDPIERFRAWLASTPTFRREGGGASTEIKLLGDAIKRAERSRCPIRRRSPTTCGPRRGHDTPHHKYWQLKICKDLGRSPPEMPRQART